MCRRIGTRVEGFLFYSDCIEHLSQHIHSLEYIGAAGVASARVLDWSNGMHCMLIMYPDRKHVQLFLGE